MKVLYNLVIYLFNSLAYLAASFNPKARHWVNGQKGWPEKVKSKIMPGDRTCWIHCASLGEFEQGRPIIEKLKAEHPDLKIVITFFSPSGYEIRKDYPQADVVCYLPADTPGKARKFIELVNPSFAIIVKYEFWNNFISVLYNKNIPLYLVSGIFRPGQHFFKWYGSFFRSILRKFTWIFVQDAESCKLLSNIGLKNVSVTGDTRFDRVVQITGTAREIPQIETFRNAEKMFLAGSSWWQDEEIFARYINNFPGKMKWVFAPHEIDKTNIDRLQKLFKVKTVKFSEFTEASSDARILIIDNIGMLSSAYKYAYIAGIGGGFGKGIHNILEPTCWGIPVMFGPRHGKFMEAINLINEEGAMTFKSYSDFTVILDRWLSDDLFYLKSAKSAGDYVQKNTGATVKILQVIFPGIT